MTYKVLIIDDEPWTRDVIKRLGHWEQYNMEIIGEASDGLAGLKLVEFFKPDLVITDIKMPVMDGMELMDSIHEKYDTKMIVISGYSDFDFVRNALKNHVMDYLLKPINPEALNKLLERFVKERLLERQREQTNIGADLSIKSSWFGTYSELKKMLVISLNTHDVKQSKRFMTRIKELIETQCTKETELGEVVKFYCDMVSVLEGYLFEEDIDIKELRTNKMVFKSYTTFLEAIDNISELYKYLFDTMDAQSSHKRMMDIEEIRHYIDLKYTENITLEQLGERFHVSVEHLSRSFKAHIGMNFVDYLTKKQMEKAKEMLIEQQIPIKSISEFLGFYDTAHFYKKFKRYHGQTPGSVRNGAKKLNIKN